MDQVKRKVYALPNKSTPGQPVVFDPELCNGCNRCVNICLMDILVPNPEKRQPPMILYPDECTYDGCCVEECPVQGAIKLSHPLMSRVHWKRKDTGEVFRV